MRVAKILVSLVVVLGVFCGRGASAGEIVGWGGDTYGQATPPDGNDFVAIAAGLYHNLALKRDGSIHAWGVSDGGANDFDQVTNTPPGNDYVAIAAGGYHSLALESDGSIVGWGFDGDGRASPPAGTDYVAIAAGEGHSLALKSNGSIVGWGLNNEGQASAPAGTGFVAIAAGGFHSLALKSDGSIVAWGNDDDGQASPPAGTGFVAIAAGENHSLALKSNGSIVGWGINLFGQASPPAGTGFVAIAAGGWHSLALKSDGSVVGWGLNQHGQTSLPVGTDFVAIAGGGYHSLALKKAPMGTAFTYKGRLMDAGNPANGDYDFQFRLYNNRTSGIQQGETIDVDNCPVIDGDFTVLLDFGGDVFAGDARWLDISVRPGASNDPDDFVTLSPRHELTPTPYAIYAANAGTDSDWIISGDDMYSAVPGNVGIGTSNPRGKLEVSHDGATADLLVGPTGNVGIGTPSPAGKFDVGHYLVVGATGNVGIGTTSPAGRLDVNHDLVVNANGNVGIGTTSPAGRLDVNHDLVVNVNGNVGIGTTNPRGPLEVSRDGATADLVVGPAGKVGIGTAQPSKLLHITNSTGGYDGLGIRLDPHGGGYAGGTNWDIDNNGGNFELTESRALPGYPQTRLAIYEGKVGIGTTRPDAKLEVRLDAGSDTPGHGQAIRLGYNGLFGFRNSADGQRLHIDRYNSGWQVPAITIDRVDGNVGIGTTSPARKLHINDVMRLEPRTSPPPNPSEGDIFMNGVDHRLYVFNGTRWMACY